MNAVAFAEQVADSWCADDLEYLGACPCCKSSKRSAHVSELRDFSSVAPGEWTLWRCHGCRCAYLDPRPTGEGLKRAYAGYHTHRACRRGWRHVADWARFRFRVTMGSRHPDHLSRCRGVAPGNGQLLDVGFGGGYFLETAKWLGYRVSGIDFDPAVVEAARKRGFDVRQGGMPGSGFEPGTFAHVTMSNVLEHLQDPIEALREALDLLEPGGRLWLNQPNLAAAGAKYYGRFWRGYEAPRHLTLWAASDLVSVLRDIGFADVTLLAACPGAQAYYAVQSELQKLGQPPDVAPKSMTELATTLAQKWRRDGPSPREQGESLTIIAKHPR